MFASCQRSYIQRYVRVVLLLRIPRQIVNINQTSEFTCFPRILLLRSTFMSHYGSRFSFLQALTLCSQLEPLLCMKEYAVRNISIAFMNCLVYFALLLFVLVNQVTKNTQRYGFSHSKTINVSVSILTVQLPRTDRR